MLMDHIGFIFFPDEVVWRIIGRIAFPLYAYGIVLGYRHTTNVKRYAWRLFILAIISQIPFMLAFNTITFNVIVTLLFSLIVLIALDLYKHIAIQGIIVILGVIVAGLIPMDYGAYGVLLVLLFRYVDTYWVFFLHVCLNLIFLFFLGWNLQVYSLFASLLIVMIPRLGEIGRKTTPTWLWRSFYPAHLLVLAMIYYILQ